MNFSTSPSTRLNALQTSQRFCFKTFLLGLFIFCTSFTGGMIWASEEGATEKMMELLVGYKDEGFVNVRGERRGYLANAGVLKQRIKLFKGQEYLAVVAGDEDVGEVKLSVKDRKGKTEFKQVVEKGQAILTFAPDKKDKYYFVIEAPQKGGYYHFSLVTK